MYSFEILEAQEVETKFLQKLSEAATASEKTLVSLDTENAFKVKGEFNTRKDVNRLIQLKIYNDPVVYVLDRRIIDNDIITFDMLRYLFQNTTVIGHNIRYDIEILLSNYKIFLYDVHDTMVMSRHYAPRMKSHSLAECSRVYLNKIVNKEQQESDWGRATLTPEQYQYAALDPVVTEELFKYLMPKLKQANRMRCYTIDRRDIHVTAICNYNGLNMNVNGLIALQSELEQQLHELKVICHKHLKGKEDLFGGTPVNLDSPEQVIEALHRIKIPVSETNRNALLPYSSHEAVKAYIEYNSASTKKSTHVDNYIKHLEQVDSEYKIYPKIEQFFVVTGRKTAKDPVNIMNLVRENKYRSNITAGEGYTFIAADYNALEARISAAITNCGRMLQMFTDSKEMSKSPEKYTEKDFRLVDMHYDVAYHILKKDVMEVTKAERQFYKTYSYGLIYGASQKRLQTEIFLETGVMLPIEEVRKGVNIWYSLYPEYKIWQEETRKIYGKKPMERTNNSVITALNFEIPLDVNKEWVVNEALNYQVQSVGAFGTKYAETLISEWLIMQPWGTLYDINVATALQVHDELLVRVPIEHQDEALYTIKHLMELAMEKVTFNKVPMLVEPKITPVWTK